MLPCGVFTIFDTELGAAFRSLRRSPAFSVVAVAMLALGIGANAAVFSIFQSIILKPLPFAEPHRLVGFTSHNPSKALAQPSVSMADFRDFHERSASYEALAACRPDFISFAPPGADPAQLIGALVTEDFFRALGVPPWRGRHFRREEFSAAAPRTAVLSFAAWRNRFGEDPGILGRTVTLNDEPTTIVGVMPEVFREPEFVELWLPFPAEAPENMARDSRYWIAAGRLKPGRTPEAAQAEAIAIAAALEQEYPGTNRGWTVGLQPMREMRTVGVRTSLLVLAGAVGLVLIVACVNLANLMLSRGVARMPEFAVRLALGATPGTLARGVLIESVLLALVGGTLGAGLSAAVLPALAAQLPPGLVPRTQEIGIDRVALTFAVSLSVLTGIVFGSLPAWQVWRVNVNDLLKSGHARGLAGGFARRLQAGLIVGQIAATIVVLAGAGLLMRSVLALQRTDLGFDPRHVITLRIATDVNKWSEFTALALYYERLLDELRRVPGVEAAALNCSAPLTGITLRFPFSIQGRPRAESGADEAVFNSVDPDYFKTLRVPLREGRTFDARDHERAPAVCVINAALAQRLFPGENPLGKRIQIVPWLKSGHREVIGVVGDVKQNTRAEAPQPQVYVPSRQSPWFFTLLLVRTNGNVATSALQAAVRRASPNLSMATRTLDDAIASTAAQPRLRAILFAIFAATALLLSAFGLYASMTFSVSQRVREIGVRLALGATPGDVLWWVLGEAGGLTAIGVLAGLIGAVLFSRVLRGLLYGVSPLDPLVLASVALFLPLVALLATLAPALRAARLNPTQALQHE